MMNHPDFLAHQRARLTLAGKYTRQQINDIQRAWQVYDAALTEAVESQERTIEAQLEMSALWMRNTTGTPPPRQGA